MYENLLSENGVFQLNDCCFSEAGMKQNLGVLEAVTRFIKMRNFVPIAITNSDWSDLILAKQGNKIIEIIDQNIELLPEKYVEVPDQLLGALRVSNKGCVSFK